MNENNRLLMSQNSTDLRRGVNGLCGDIRKIGLVTNNGEVYIFVNKSRQVMNTLHWERCGYAIYYKRLEQGRFHPRIFLKQGMGFRSIRWDELVLLMEGISLRTARRKRFQSDISQSDSSENNASKMSKTTWLTR